MNGLGGAATSGFWWKPSPPPLVVSAVECPPPATLQTSWQACAAPVAFADSPRVGVAPPRVASAVIRVVPPRVRSFCFAPPDEAALPMAAPSAPATVPTAAAGAAPPPAAARPPTRIQPPSDCIKLADRLALVLQPPLEHLLRDGALDFPFAPFPFQLEGVAFLYPRHAAILADEMGLGKTMQTITALRLLLRRGEVGRVLLVCPKPLVTNWQREFARWAPEIPLVVIEGDGGRRQWLWRQDDVPVRVANYEVVVRDRELFEAGAEAPAFDLVVLDESQRIKNAASATNQVVRSIPRQRSWALTGTPVENSAADLVGICEFLAPGLLSADMQPRRIGRAVRDYVLRRTKEAVLADLPPKIVHDAELDLSAEQRQTYALAEEAGVLRLGAMGGEVTIRHVFELVIRLKQICNFDPATGASAKFERLEADLEEVAASGRKAIVFSQWVNTLDELQRRLARFRPLAYHGRVPPASRDGQIARFRDDPRASVLLLSYGAGGVGLNLQFAGYVFLFDRWWNPAVEDQAINRAHRIGVEGPVSVTRFLTLDTIEERIDRILEEKRALFDVIFAGSEPSRRLGLSQEELFGLFKLRVRQAA